MKQLMVVFDFPTASEQQYKAAWDAIRASGHANPKGLIFHVGASKPDGGMMITVYGNQNKLSMSSQKC
ncbi:MAG: hypothetical protein ICV84_22115 [Flavisolibacter sp.]|nr:hypothetical protein [Flavisolibacter sp.]